MPSLVRPLDEHIMHPMLNSLVTTKLQVVSPPWTNAMNASFMSLIRSVSTLNIIDQRSAQRQLQPSPLQIPLTRCFSTTIKYNKIDIKTPTVSYPVYSILTGDMTSTIDLNGFVFQAPIRRDIVHRVVLYQRHKRQQGTHASKTISQVSGTGKKPHKQKGTGAARQGTRRAVHHRGGGKVFGPVSRSHAIDLPKRVRAMGLRCVLSSKLLEGNLKIVENVSVPHGIKTKEMKILLERLNILDGCLIIHNDFSEEPHYLDNKENEDEREGDAGDSKAPQDVEQQKLEDANQFILSVRNLRNMRVMPARGANVYDVLKRPKLCLTTAAVTALTERLTNERNC